MVVLLLLHSLARFALVKLLAPEVDSAGGEFAELNESLEKLSRGELDPPSDSVAFLGETNADWTPLAGGAAEPAELWLLTEAGVFDADGWTRALLSETFTLSFGRLAAILLRFLNNGCLCMPFFGGFLFPLCLVLGAGTGRSMSLVLGVWRDLFG